MLNYIHFVALHVLMFTVSSFAISNQGHLVMFDAILMLLIGSLVWLCCTARLPLTLPALNISKLLTVKNI